MELLQSILFYVMTSPCSLWKETIQRATWGALYTSYAYSLETLEQRNWYTERMRKENFGVWRQATARKPISAPLFQNIRFFTFAAEALAIAGYCKYPRTANRCQKYQKWQNCSAKIKRMKTLTMLRIDCSIPLRGSSASHRVLQPSDQQLHQPKRS